MHKTTWGAEAEDLPGRGRARVSPVREAGAQEDSTTTRVVVAAVLRASD